MDLLTTVVADLLLATDKKFCTAVVFIVFSKAFDNVNHRQRCANSLPVQILSDISLTNETNKRQLTKGQTNSF